MEDLETIDRPEADESSPAWESAPDHKAPAPMAYAGVMVIVWLCFLRPFEWVSAIYAFPVGILLGVLSLIAIGMFIFGGHRAQLSWELKWLLLLAAQMCLATPFAHWRGGAFDKVVHDVAIIVLMSVAVGFAVNSLDRIKGVIRAEAISLSVLTVLTLKAGVHDSEGRLVGVGGTFSNSNDLAAILAVTVPFCLMFLFITRGILSKLFWVCSAAAMVYTINGTFSRSGLISLAVGIVVCLWNFGSKERRRGALILLALIVVSMLALISSSPSFRDRLSTIGGDVSNTTGVAASANSSSLERQQLLRRAIQVMLNHPLLGVGPGNFYPYSGAQYGDWHVSHNTYTQCGAEAGIPALLFFVLMLITAVKHCKRIQRRPGVTANVKAFAIALRSSLLAYAVAAFFADTAYQFFPYFLVTVAGALWQLDAAQLDAAVTTPGSSIDSRPTEDAVLDPYAWAD
jgi:O-antigen ligase